MSDCPNNDNNIARCVRQTMSDYFKDLDGEEPTCGLYDMVIHCAEKPLIESVLQHAGGNQTRTAALLGINRNTLRKKMQEHGIT